MKSPRIGFRALSVAMTLASTLLFSSTALADFPDRPLRLFIPFAAGGPTDHLARTFAQELGNVLGQPVIAENRPGGNSLVAVQAMLGAQPDGYTMLFAGLGTTVLNPMLFSNLAYDVDRDLGLVGLTSSMPLVMLINPDLPVQNVDEFIAYAKERPGQLNYGTPGVGNPLHLSTDMFARAAGIEMQNIPYNGTAPALTALIAGDIHAVFDVVQSALPFIESGRLRPLAVTTAERNPALPEVPTFAESGFPGYAASSWFMLAVPAQTPDDVKEKLNQATQRVAANPQYIESLEKLGLMPFPPKDFEQLNAFVASEQERWGAIIRANNITLD